MKTAERKGCQLVAPFVVIARCCCCCFLFVIALLRAEKRQRQRCAKGRGGQPKIANPVGALKLTSMNTLWVNNRKTIQRKSLAALWAFWPAS